MIYVVKTGCQWRLLPNEYPPWQSVYRYFRAWNKKGVWRKLQLALGEKVRRQEGKRSRASAIVIDSQSVKTGKYAPVESRGFDGGKKVKGRKRHIIVDTLGIPLEMSVTRGNVHDTKGGAKVIAKLARRHKNHRIRKVFADKGYQGANFAKVVSDKLGTTDVELSANPAMAAKRFIPVRKRWVVERTFAWFGDYWRLSVDRERTLVSSLAMLRIAVWRLLVRRLRS